MIQIVTAASGSRGEGADAGAVVDQLRSVTGAVVVPRLIARIDGAVRVVFDLGGASVHLDLWPHSVRSSDYRLLLDEGAGLHAVEPGPARTWRGSVAGDPQATVAASIQQADVLQEESGGCVSHRGVRIVARILLDDGGSVWLEPDVGAGRTGGAHRLRRVDSQEHRVREAHAIGTCGVPAATARDTGIRIGRDPPERTAPLCAELACDTDAAFVAQWGTVRAVEFRVNAIVNLVNLQYERDVGRRHVLTALIVRAGDDPYRSNDAAGLADELRDLWLATLSEIPRDLVLLFTGRALDGAAIGYAWQIGSICTDGGFCVARSTPRASIARSTDLVAHELGHLWGAIHCSCLSPPYTMNAAITGANRFQPTETIPDIIETGLECLETCDLRGCIVDCLPADGAIDLADLLTLLSQWGGPGGCDLSGDGVVDVVDLGLLLQHWGPCPPADRPV